MFTALSSVGNSVGQFMFCLQSITTEISKSKNKIRMDNNEIDNNKNLGPGEIFI